MSAPFLAKVFIAPYERKSIKAYQDGGGLLAQNQRQ